MLLKCTKARVFTFDGVESTWLTLKGRNKVDNAFGGASTSRSVTYYLSVDGSKEDLEGNEEEVDLSKYDIVKKEKTIATEDGEVEMTLKQLVPKL